MARAEVWNETRTLFQIAGTRVAEARFFIAQDDSKELPHAFRMLASFRILGAQIDNDEKTNNFEVKNGDVSVPIAVAAFSDKIDGKIIDWHGTDPDGSHSSDGTWSKAEKVALRLSAIARVAIPVGEILNLVPGIGGVLRAILSALPGQRVSFTVGLLDADIPVHRKGDRVVLPAKAVVPAWWP